MNKNFILLIILLLIIILGCFSINNKSKTIAKENIISFIGEDERLFKPSLEKNIDLNLNAKIASSTLLTNDQKIILYENNLEEKTAIASITKLMSAVIVIDNYPSNSKILIDEKMLSAWGTSGSLKLGEHITIENLLYIMLIESSNDAAECLASKLDRENFIILMNEKAKKLKMKKTFFVNPSGLDEDDGTYNTSSAKDLTILASEIIKNYPLIPEILSHKEYTVKSEEGVDHKITTTNSLLREMPIGTWGKTGYTEIANGCLILMTKNDLGDIIINIIINSNDRFREMKNLTTWINNSFSF
ncbi:MAG: serine hydrolase [Candidatus Pacebacteria bacterium]|nr:serine hydrolase [Candidatus Paceibacterota bacterium]